MKIFRIKIYLTTLILLKSFFLKKVNFKIIDKIFLGQTKKKYVVYTSQLRSSFLLVLMYLKKKFRNKNEVIVLSYNLKEMINIVTRLKLKVIFCDLDLKNGSMKIDDLKRKISSKTLCIVLTNIFSNYESCNEIKNFCKKRNIILIEDNAIYFDNFTYKKKKIFSGSFGDYSLSSFNIMKNISGLYGGCVAFNDKEFSVFVRNNLKKHTLFPKFLYLRQLITFFFLKVFSINLFYRNLFHFLIYLSFKNKIRFIQNIIYPSLRFKKISIPNYYLSKISKLSKKLIYYQLINKTKRTQNHNNRKVNNKLYYNFFKNMNSNQIHLFKIDDFDFQNFLDFPVLFNNRDKLHIYLFEKGFDTKLVHYFDCSRVFNSKTICKNSQLVEKRILCLPNHSKINKNYIKALVKEISFFYQRNT